MLIGGFTLLGGLAALLFALWLARYGNDEDMQPYDIVFREAVSGLSVGSPVQYSGIRVGEVQSLNLDPDDPGQVWARISVSASAPVRTDTRAALTLLNITGASAISLSEGSPDSPRLHGQSRGVPVIEAEPSPLARLQTNTDELLVQVTTLLENANRILSRDNARRLARILDNLDTVTAGLAGQQDTLRNGLEGLANSGRQLNTLLERLDEQVISRSGSMLDSANRTVEHIEQVSQQLEQLVADNGPLVNSGLQSLQEVGPAIRDLRQLLNSLRTVSERLEDNPGSLLFGNEPIREFQP
jgi:phospholipid/cholesterol/gamma-HCH transport system substrate-binding protein